MCHHAADDQVHPIGKAVPVPPCFNEGAVGNQVGQQPLEGGALVAGDLEALEQLPGGRRVIHVVANLLEDLLVVQHFVNLSANPDPFYSNRAGRG